MGKGFDCLCVMVVLDLVTIVVVDLKNMFHHYFLINNMRWKYNEII